MAYKEIINIDKHVTKKGKIKGKNKAETKLLRTSCCHHRYNNKGHLKQTTIPIRTDDGETHFICRRCGCEFTPTVYTKKDVKEAIIPVIDILENDKFIAAATNSGQNVISYLVQTEVAIKKLPKVNKKLAKIASRRSDIKNKKKNRNTYSSNSYGSWSIKSR